VPTNNGYAQKLGGLAQSLAQEKGSLDPKKVAAILMDISMAIQQLHARIEILESKS
jgi:hypothetical protein